MQIWTHEIDGHVSLAEDRSQLTKIDQEILQEYNEIKSDIEENELRYNLTYTRPFSSYLVPKDPAHLARERHLFLERLAHVPSIADPPWLADQLADELNTCLLSSSDYASDALPLLLHTFFLKRLSALVYAKTLHGVRWKRFCRQQIQFDQVEQQFHARSARILAEFNDAFQRSQRLSAVREALLTPASSTSKNTIPPVANDDYIAYVRYLVCHYRGQKYFDQLAALVRTSHLKFRTLPSSESKSLVLDLRPPASPFQTTTAFNHVPMMELEQKQTLKKLNILFRQYSLPLDTSKIRSPGDEMELYANIIRHYRTIFLRQEKQRPMHFSAPSSSNAAKDKRKSPEYVFIKPSPWIDFLSLNAERDPQRERDYWRYIRSGKPDELLLRITQFLHVRSADRAAGVLKQYLLTIKTRKHSAVRQALDEAKTNPVQAVPISDIFWKNIFELNADDTDEHSNEDDSDELRDSFVFPDKSARSARFMKRDEFNYLETLQKLGLDDTFGQQRETGGGADDDDTSESYGLQLSYITLRFLRIRTLRHCCLHELNYLRSIQRTLTIYEQRLTIDSKEKQILSVDQRFSTYVPHTYIFDSPSECTLDALNYMQTGEHLDNVEDYAHESNDGDDADDDMTFIYVRDAVGYYVVYDCALNDVKELEQEMIAIGSYFIDKALLKQEKTDAVQTIDRFEILYNLWEYELTYLQYKRKLIDCFYEIYQHTFDEDERRLIGQTIADIGARRPRIDFRNDDYFSHSYSLEIRFLNQYLSLVREYIDRHVHDIRHMTENLTDAQDFGAYFPSQRSASSPPVYLSVSKIHSYYLFEFLESLSSLTRLPHLLKQAFNELVQFEQCQRQADLSTTERLLYELECLDEICTAYRQLDQPGTMFSPNYQRDVFNTLFSDHPTLMGRFAGDLLKQVDVTRTTKKEQFDKFMKFSTHLLELLTLRYRLVRSASECEVLTKIYKQQLDVMGMDHSHLSLRFVQFDFAQTKNLTDTEIDVDFESCHVADGRLDKITGQNHLLFAIQELEEGTIGRINFRQQDQWLALINEGDEAMTNLKVALRFQLMHNHLLHSAILQHRLALVCITQQLNAAKAEQSAERSKAAVATTSTGKRLGVKQQVDQSNTLLNDAVYETTRRKLFRENYFVSIQFEKSPGRDRILHEYLRQRELKPMQYQQPREAEKLKRSLLNEFIDRIHQRNGLILLRLQIIQSYLSLAYLVRQFPLTSRTHFMWPKTMLIPAVPTAPSTDQTEAVESTDVPTANGYQHRPGILLDTTGTDLVNLWYIPSFTELLAIFKGAQLDRIELHKRLKNVLRLVSSLNDLIHIVVAYARLTCTAKSAEQRFHDPAGDLTNFDQSGEFASELHEIQREIDSSPSPSLPTIADLLEAKRRLTILQIYHSISYTIPNGFLSRKNPVAFEHVRSRSQPILRLLLGDYDPFRPIYSVLATPLLTIQPLAKQLYPWTVYERRFNIHAKSLWWPEHMLTDLIHVSLVGLKSQELTLANSELISIQVMLQNIDDVITTKALVANADSILRQREVPTGDHLTHYRRLELYLTECIRLELVQHAWSAAKFSVHTIGTLKTFDDASARFRDEIRAPVLRQLSAAIGYSSFYNDFPSALAKGQLAPKVTEYECKRALVTRILLELEGKFMMNDTLKRLKKERNWILSERLREENSLPTDLWKKQDFAENFSVARPHVLDEFARLLAEHEAEPRPDLYCIRRTDLDHCLKELGGRVMQRERENYHSYSSYYESLLHNIRQLLGTREQEIDSLRSQLHEHHFNLDVESQLLTLSAYFDLIGELVHVRSERDQLQINKRLQLDKEVLRIRNRFQSTNEQLLSTNLVLRQRFEQFREQLYHDTISIVKAIRSEVYAMAQTKLTYDATSIDEQQQTEQNTLIDRLQDELHRHNEQQAADRLEREERGRREHVEMEKNLEALQYQLDQCQKRFVYHTRKQTEEIQTLKSTNNYLRKRIVFNEGQYRKLVEAEAKSETKANVERHDDLRQALSEKSIIETKLRCIQEKTQQLTLKDLELERKTSEYERVNQAMRVTQTYVKRDLAQTKKKLESERSLKYDAFQQVESLRTNLNELEQIVVNDSLVTELPSSRSMTPYQLLVSRNRPMTSNPLLSRDRQRLSTARLRSQTSHRRAQTANVHFEKITPLTEELLSNLGASSSASVSSMQMLRVKSAKI